MSLIEQYREEYYSRLVRCLDIIALNEKYNARKDEYKRLLAEINSELAENGAISQNAEDLIDGTTGGLRRGAEMVVNGDTALLDGLRQLATLRKKLSEFVGLHAWDDEVMNAVDVILAIAGYQDYEDEMREKLGKEAAERIIYEEKRRVSVIEAERGMYFFADGVAVMETIFKIRTLCPTATELSLDRVNNADELDIELTNDRGERIRFRKTGQITHEGAMYVELVLLDDLRIPSKLWHYRVDQSQGGIVLTLVEDEKLRDVLFDKIEDLIV